MMDEGNNNSKGDTHKKRSIDNEDIKMKELGRKTRKRLQEEQKKKRKVVVLDASQTYRQTRLQINRNDNKKGIAIAPVVKKRTSIRTKKQPSKRATACTRVRSSTNAGNHNNNANIDYRTPEIKHLKALLYDDDDNKEHQSNVVRLHGLPIGTKPKNIRQFFSGLDPERIFIIPTNKLLIQCWDDDDDDDDDDEEEEEDNTDDDDDDDDSDHNNSNKRKRKQKSYLCTTSKRISSNTRRIKRYRSNFRVFVKFSTVHVSSLALERSGEVLYCAHNDKDSNHSKGKDQYDKIEETRHDDRDKKKTSAHGKLGVSISISEVPKSISNYILRFMAIDAVNGIPLESTLSICERQLPKIVPAILWTAFYTKIFFKKKYEDNISINNSCNILEKSLQYDVLMATKDERESLPMIIKMTKMEMATIISQKKNLSSQRQKLQRQQRALFVQRHNKLVTEYEKLLDFMPPSFCSSSSYCDNFHNYYENPIIRLTNNASNCLYEEIERIKEIVQIINQMI